MSFIDTVAVDEAEGDVDRLKVLGFDDGQILDIAGAAAGRAYCQGFGCCRFHARRPIGKVSFRGSAMPEKTPTDS